MHFPDYKNAESFAIKALELSEKYHVGEGQCWMNIANIFFNQQNYAESKINCLKAKDYFERNNSFDDLARCYSYLGNIAYNQNETKSSLIYYQKALENYKKVQSLIGERITLYNLAEINLGLKTMKKLSFMLMKL
jgi:tetratricopeptide (TPR) repeat protein